ncbi:hypothetical protein KI387_027615, partial [Taxus chinensis]
AHCINTTHQLTAVVKAHHCFHQIISKAGARHLVIMGGALLLSLLHIMMLGTPPLQTTSLEKSPRLNLAIPTHGEVDLEEEVAASWELPDASKDFPSSGWLDDHDTPTSG